MKSQKIILFANYFPGLEICKYLVSEGEHIERMYIVDPEESFAKKIIQASKLSKKNIFTADKIKEPEHIKELKQLDVDFMITVYWPYLLKPEIFKVSKNGCINFHPAFLPVNRGWYPHVHSILDGTPTGVTLHLIDENADTGPILVQREVQLEPIDTAGSIYHKLQNEIVLMFKENWTKIKNHEITPIAQDQSKSIYHKKSEISSLDFIDLEKEYKAKDLINILKARTFDDKSFAYFIVDGKKIYLNLKLSYNNNFEG